MKKREAGHGKRISRWDDVDWTIAFDSSITFDEAASMIGCSAATVHKATAAYGGRLKAPVTSGDRKRCIWCSRSLPLDSYSINRSHSSGLNSKCRDCLSEYQRSKSEQHAERARAYRAKDPGRLWLAQYNQRIRKFFPGSDPDSTYVSRDHLLAEYGDECFHCGGPFNEIDHHPIPVRHRGPHSLANLKPSCAPCNRRSMKVEDMQLEKQGEVAV